MNTEYDEQYGALNEDYAEMIIKEKWNIKDLTKLDKYNGMDFHDKQTNTYYEIKARRIKHSTFKTTMIGYDKIRYAKKLNTDVYFIFIFDDGDYYYKYNSNDTYLTSIGGRNDRGCEEYKPYYYIPISNLIKI